MTAPNSEQHNLAAFGSLDWMGSSELGQPERELVGGFRDALQDGLAVGSSVVDIEGSTPRINPASGKSIDQQLLPKIEEIGQDGRFVLSPDFAWLGSNEFSKFRILRSGRAETSAHQVFFGAIQSVEDESRGVLVAVKPCIERDSTACNDWLNAHLARKAGERNFNPVGFLLHGGRGYSITELDRGVETLDNSEWQQVLLDEQNPAYAGQIEVLGDVAKHLAQLHQKQIFHEDPQFKNIALDISGEMFLIDWESSTFFEGDINPEVLRHKIEHDLKVLFGSMARSVQDNGVGLLHVFKHPIQWQLFKKYIFDPYIETYLEGEDESGMRFGVVADVEESLQTYIETGALYESLKRHRGHHK